MLRNKPARIAINIVATLLIAFIVFYFTLPAISIHSPVSLAYMGGLVVLYFVISSATSAFAGKEGFKLEIGPMFKICAGIIAALVLVFIVGSISSARILRASSYQKMLNVQEGNFVEEIDEVSFNQIPMLDKDSAIRLGDKKMGELSDLVSQFEVNEMYSQINYKERPMRTTYLEYGDIIKWWNNRKQGLPAYIMIDMVTQETTVVKLSEGMKYSPADLFGRNLQRHLRFRYPTYIFAEESLEIDDNGHPYWVCPKIKFTIGLFGGRDVDGIVLVDAITGDTQYYATGEVPQWIDRVYSADLLIEQFDNYGMLKHGYWNTIFGQRDALTSTRDYNYIAMNDDIYVYSGATSVVSDQSNVGFLLINQRTKDAKFYAIAGATEHSAMSSAEGQVQHLGYTATFPLLLNIANEPTYFLALKDNAKLVKQYAMVNVERYQIVAIGDTAQECEKEYKRLLIETGVEVSDSSAMKMASGKITSIRSAVREGMTYFYITLDSSDLTFSTSIATSEEVITYNEGDTVEIEYLPAENVAIISIVGIQRTNGGTAQPSDAPTPSASGEPSPSASMSPTPSASPSAEASPSPSPAA